MALKLEVAKYIASGLVSGAMTIGTSMAVYAIWNSQDIASVIGWVVGVSTSFLLQKIWVFESKGRSGTATIKFVAVTTFAWLCGILVYLVCTRFLAIPYFFTQVVVLGVVSVANFTLNRNWTFKTKPVSANEH